MNHFSFRSNQDVDVVRVVLAAGEVLIEAHLVAQLGADGKAYSGKPIDAVLQRFFSLAD